MALLYRIPMFSQDLSAIGIQGDWTFGMANKVHFHELDVLQHVNNGAYLRWFEDLRVSYFTAWGMTDYKEGDPRMVVRRVSMDYFKEMKMAEDYVAVVRTKAFRKTSFVMEFGVYSGDLRATGEAVVVMLDSNVNKKRPLPEALIDRFVKVDKAVAAG